MASAETAAKAKTKAAKPAAAEPAKAAAEAAPEEAQKQPLKVKDIDPNQFITVRNGFQGTLVYRSRHTGETYIWDSFGAEQDIELIELKRAKSSYKAFFENNWFLFDDDWVIDYLGVRALYRYARSAEDFDKLFDQSPEELAETLSHMSAGQKRSVAYRARTLIAEGKIDSNRIISTLESALGAELVTRQ